MLKIYRDTEGTVRSGGADDDLPGHVIWMDLLNPDEKEIEFVRRRAKVVDRRSDRPRIQVKAYRI